MQVLAGTARRKKLLSPKGMDVRPMMEVVKGAAFDILQVAGGNPASLRPGRWLDLYSGTGSVGIEAISRGCSEAHFVEMDPWVISEVLRPNLEWTEFLDASVIHTLRVETFLERADKFVVFYLNMTKKKKETQDDVTWKHCTKVGDGKKAKLKCNYCGKEYSGEENKMKKQLLGDEYDGGDEEGGAELVGPRDLRLKDKGKEKVQEAEKEKEDTSEDDDDDGVESEEDVSSMDDD
ncbi:hypothetical protein IFM89_001878 [Coptis chinensis]|uniref:Uncharacterized protein n=1 Tax=Coptis chinensis TaxID=261450 RepID=A0A835IL55_9MAGN|nr:hypothetical protein IFM89_001878 [Coptis chinensis]